MKNRLICTLVIMLLLLSFSACSNATNEITTQTTTESITENELATEQSTTTSAKSAVIYFSATGTTKGVAEVIAKESNSDLLEIKPVKPYSSDDLNYNDNSCRANAEQNDSLSRPEIQNDLSSASHYDTIYLGYPIWWGTNPRIIQTFLDSCDLSNANIYLFCTSGSSDIETSVNDLKSNYPSLNIIDGKRFVSASKEDVTSWLSNNK